MSRSLLALALITSVATTAGAQDDGPRAGSWAVEGASGGAASLLRFRGPTSAWVFGVTAQYSRAEVEDVDIFTGEVTTQTQETISSQLRVGLRRYSNATSPVRRFSTASLVVGHDRSFATRGWSYGATGEYGAAYFFNTRVSLGGSGDLSVLYLDTKPVSPVADSRRTWTLRFSGFRLVGGIYF